MTTKETASAIRATFKKNNIKNISVYAKENGYSHAIDIILKDFSISMQQVRELLTCYEFIHCDLSGEILSGGSAYINISYDYDLMKAKEKELIPIARKIKKKLTGNNISVISNDDYCLFYSCNILWARIGDDDYYDQKGTSINKNYTSSIAHALVEIFFVNRDLPINLLEAI